MDIAEELKRKRTELIGDMEPLALRIETIKKQIGKLSELWFDATDPAQFWERAESAGLDTRRLRVAFTASAIVGCA